MLKKKKKKLVLVTIQPKATFETAYQRAAKFANVISFIQLLLLISFPLNFTPKQFTLPFVEGSLHHASP